PLRRPPPRDPGGVAHAPDRDGRQAGHPAGMAAPHDDARARGAPSLADRHVRGPPGLAGPPDLRADLREHPGAPARATRTLPGQSIGAPRPAGSPADVDATGDLR